MKRIFHDDGTYEVVSPDGLHRFRFLRTLEESKMVKIVNKAMAKRWEKDATSQFKTFRPIRRA